MISLFHRYTALKTQANLILLKIITYSLSSEYCCFDKYCEGNPGDEFDQKYMVVIPITVGA